jgi:carboxymethylenebutenolidase
MERKKASDFPQELLNLFDGYVHGRTSRRDFLESAQKFATAGVTAAMLLEQLRPNYALANEVAADDKRLVTDRLTVPSPQGNGSVIGYFARPKSAEKLPVILVIHENRGLNPYIEDVVRRVALLGYVAYAPDGLTSKGGYPGDEEKAAAMFQQVDAPKMQEDFIASARWLKSRPDTTGTLGVIGFCFGGTSTNNLAVRMGSEIAAAVPFYGRPPATADVARIKAPISAQYAELDTALTTLWPAYDAALTQAGVPHEGFVYKATNHGFHNDTTPRYDEAAAKEAWGHATAWFEKYLRNGVKTPA